MQIKSILLGLVLIGSVPQVQANGVSKRVLIGAGTILLGCVLDSRSVTNLNGINGPDYRELAKVAVFAGGTLILNKVICKKLDLDKDASGAKLNKFLACTTSICACVSYLFLAVTGKCILDSKLR
jgi:hypothetical protein